MADDQQIAAEALDPYGLGDDPSVELEFPPERLLGSTDEGRNDRATDSVVERVRREEPDDRAGRAASELDAAGRLVATTPMLADDEATLVGAEVAADDLSAEEAAVHVTSEPA